MQTGSLNIDRLPSNKLKDELLKDTNFTEVEKNGALDEKPANGISLLTIFNQKAIINFHHSKKSCSVKSDLKCCRDINYYLDLIRALINFSDSSEDHKVALKQLVKNAWEGRLGKSGYNCQNTSDEESVRKRSILKQLHDYCDDKNDIDGKEEEYKNYLKEKWNRIISYTTSANDNIYFKIEDWNNNQSVKYIDFLLKPQIECSSNYNRIELSHISVSNENPTTEVARGVAVRNGDEDRGATADEQANSGPGEGARLTTSSEGYTTHHVVIEPRLEEKEGEMGSSLRETLSAGFSVVGAVFFLFFLYKFSPVGPWISTLIKKKPGEKRGTSDDESFLFLNNPEHNNHYISYNSISH
ncbi:PIR protein [Plasmodium ovale]|uniref:PIR protein n=1 Tax=Plasmodium ovale TaxID=36330 RepID=A0A1D3JBK2_PLAOA|nr:PIR protein [Plasmodium ovale]